MTARAVGLKLHRWSGLFLAAFLVVSGLTGAMLAYYDEIEAALIPRLMRVEARNTPMLAPVDLVRAAERLEPRARVELVPLARRPDHSVTVSLVPRVDPRSGALYVLDFDEVFLDPYSGAVLGTRLHDARGLSPTQLMPTIHALHESLLAGKWGEWLLGCVALVWFCNCLLGFYLTLPAQRRNFFKAWKRSWLVRSAQSVMRFSFELHRAAGSWLWIALMVFALSAVQFNLNEPLFRPLLKSLLPFGEPQVAMPKFPLAFREPTIGWDAAHAHARALLAKRAASDGFVVYEESYLAHVPRLAAYVYGTRTSLDIRQKGGQTQLYFSANDGRELAFHYPTIASGNAVSTWLSALHMARVWGEPYRIFVTLTGISVAMFSITGVIVWLGRRTPTVRHKGALQ